MYFTDHKLVVAWISMHRHEVSNHTLQRGLQIKKIANLEQGIS